MLCPQEEPSRRSGFPLAETAPCLQPFAFPYISCGQQIPGIEQSLQQLHDLISSSCCSSRMAEQLLHEHTDEVGTLQNPDKVSPKSSECNGFPGFYQSALFLPIKMKRNWKHGDCVWLLCFPFALSLLYPGARKPLLLTWSLCWASCMRNSCTRNGQKSTKQDKISVAAEATCRSSIP